MLTIGLNSASHDSSVAAVEDGEVVYAAAEERFSRVKHDRRFPEAALKAALDHVGASLREVDGVAFGWNTPGLATAFRLARMATGHIPFGVDFVKGHIVWGVRELYTGGGKLQLKRDFGPLPPCGATFIDHHEAHAWSAFALSGFDEAAVLVVDGSGATQATSIYEASDGALRRRKVFLYPNSLGAFYMSFTDHFGFQIKSDEWKLMGLAAYGSPRFRMDEVIRVFDDDYWVNTYALWVTEKGRHRKGEALMRERFGPRRNPEEGISQEDRDLAASVQKATEEAMLMLARMAVDLTGQRHLCLAGGVAMNSKANGAVLSSGIVDRLFIQPAATDDGTAIGAAIAYQRRLQPSMPNRRMEHVYLGPSFSTEEVGRVLDGGRAAYLHVPNIEEVAARLVATGHVVGWFQGRMEFGPRALGSRSILGDPRDVGTRDRVNASVKFREEWRPFAPSCLAERSGEYFEPEVESPFMVVTQTVRADKREVIPAVTHADQTARVHTVRRDVNPRYWKLISEFDRLTGVPVVLNTSFNLRGEPIVCTPKDALRTFVTSGLDFLVIDDFIVPKEDVRENLERAVEGELDAVGAA
jgi:carbamoyltransferase